MIPPGGVHSVAGRFCAEVLPGGDVMCKGWRSVFCGMSVRVRPAERLRTFCRYILAGLRCGAGLRRLPYVPEDALCCVASAARVHPVPSVKVVRRIVWHRVPAVEIDARQRD